VRLEDLVGHAALLRAIQELLSKPGARSVD
jgi:hypothetical protein